MDDHLDRVHADYTDDQFILRRGSITIAANLSTNPVHFPLPGLLLEAFGTVEDDTLGPHATAILRTDG
jgi:hypothetical protein